MNRLGTAAGAVLALVALSATGACTNSGEPPSSTATSTSVGCRSTEAAFTRYAACTDDRGGATTR